MWLHLTDNSRLFSPAEAEKIATELQQNDLDGWKYEVIHDPTGRGMSYIKVYDNEGEFVSKY